MREGEWRSRASAGGGGNGTCRVPVTKQEPPWVVKDAATAAAAMMIMMPAASLKIGHGAGRRLATQKNPKRSKFPVILPKRSSERRE